MNAAADQRCWLVLDVSVLALSSREVERPGQASSALVVPVSVLALSSREVEQLPRYRPATAHQVSVLALSSREVELVFCHSSSSACARFSTRPFES